MKILYVLPELPWPTMDGGNLRTFSILRSISQSATIDLIALKDPDQVDAQLEALAPYTRRIVLCDREHLSRPRQVVRVASLAARARPFYTKYVHSRQMRCSLRDLTAFHSYDLIIVSHSHMAEYLSAVCPAQSAATMLEMHNVEAVQFRRICRTCRSPRQKLELMLTWLPMMWWEPHMARAFDHVITVSQSDADLMRARISGLSTTTLPNGVDVEACRPAATPCNDSNILFVGSLGYEPNVDAVQFFHDTVFPLARERNTAYTFTIVGRRPPDAVRRLTRSPGVILHADVPDLTPHYRGAGVAVVPLRCGGGTRLKILEAMAYGTPVVSTSVGCEGLDVSDGVHLLIADTPADIAQAVHTLITEPTLAQRIAGNARELVVRQYSWSVIGASYAELCSRVASQSRLSPPAGTPLPTPASHPS